MTREDVIAFAEYRDFMDEADMQFVGLRLKDGTRISIEVADLGDTSIGLELVLSDVRVDDVETRYEFEVRIEVDTVLSGRSVDMKSFLYGMMHDADTFLQYFFSNVIMNEAQIALTNEGFGIIVNLSLRDYEEELRIPRDEAEAYFVIDDE